MAFAIGSGGSRCGDESGRSPVQRTVTQPGPSPLTDDARPCSLDERPAMPAALVTGGTTGIGRATAELLHTRGHQVAVTGQNPDSLARARLELPDDVLVVRSDARLLADTDVLVATVSERFGSLDMLFLNAGSSASHRWPA